MVGALTGLRDLNLTDLTNLTDRAVLSLSSHSRLAHNVDLVQLSKQLVVRADTLSRCICAF